MPAKFKFVERFSQSEAVVKAASGDHAGFRGSSPAVGLQRQLARHFGESGVAAKLVMEPLPVDEMLLHGVSRTAGIASLVFGYVVAGYLISQLFF